MYAVVKTGGKQLKVEQGTTEVVERLDAEVGSSITFPVLFVSDGDRIVSDPADAAAATVTAEVVEHVRGDKVIVFKFKKRKGYKRLKGHRQELTKVRITDISLPGATKAAKADAAEDAPKKKAAPRKKAAVAETAEPAAE